MYIPLNCSADDVTRTVCFAAETISHLFFLRSDYSGYLRQHGDRFFPFLADGMDLDMTSYCAREVEPMGKECEQLHIIALTEYLGLKVSIEYLDGRFVLFFYNTCY